MMLQLNGLFNRFRIEKSFIPLTKTTVFHREVELFSYSS